MGKPEKQKSGKFSIQVGGSAYAVSDSMKSSLSTIVIGKLNRTTGYEGLIALKFGRGEDLR